MLVALRSTLAVAVSAGTALAQQPPAAATDIVVTAQRVPDRITGFGAPVPIKDLPQGASVVTRDLFEQQAPLTLTDIVRNTPGVSNFRNSSETFRTFSVRGFIQFETAVDGLRNTNALNIQPDGLAAVDRVEVLRGPAAALYGRGSLGAAVDIVTLKPQSTFGARFDVTGGSRQLLIAAADLTGPLGGGFSGRLIGAYETRDSFVDFVNIRGWQVAPSLAWAGPTTRALAQFDYRARTQLRYVGLPLRGTITGLDGVRLPIGRNFGEPGLPETTNTGATATVRVEQDLARDWMLRVAGRFNRNTYDQPVAALRPLSPDNRTITRRFQRFVESEREWAAFAALTGRAQTGGMTHDIRAGFEYATFKYPSDFIAGSLASIDLLNPVYGAQPGATFLLDSTTDTIAATGVSLQDQITLTPSLKLLLSGRYDWIETERRSNLNGRAGRRTPGAFSPRVGATWDVLSGVTLYGSWGRNIESQNNGGSNPSLIPFAPVEGETYEAGVKLSRDERLAATLGVYRINATGVLTPDLANPGFAIQTGERRSQGVELELNWQPVEGLTLLGFVSYIDAAIRRDTRLTPGTPIENVPDWSGRIFAAYEAPRGALAGFGGNVTVSYQGDQPGNLAALASRFTVPGSTIVDAGLSYRTGPVRLGVQARNLLDERHFIRGAFQAGYIVPGDPRTIFLTLNYRGTAR